MPKLELKAIQRDLEQGTVWPFYWVYGPEKLKARELLKRIRKTVSGGKAEGEPWGWNEEVIDATEVDAAAILDSALSPTLGGGVRFIVVKDAHALKSPEDLAELLGPSRPLSDLVSVCVCLSKDLDGRKKFSKVLLEQAAVVPCDEVADDQRESWIQFLAKRRGITLDASHQSWILSLTTLDPWSLDTVEQELEKFTLLGLTPEVEAGNLGPWSGGEVFLDHFFNRELKSALPWVSQFAQSPDESLPLLGLLAWNVRQLAVLIADREAGTRHAKLNSFLAERLGKWSKRWKLAEIIRLQQDLFEIDFSSKQTPLLPLALWSRLVTQYCQ